MNGTLPPRAGVFFFQARAECELNSTNGDPKDKMEFRIFSGLMKFEMPSLGACVPQFGRTPLVTRHTNTSRLTDRNPLDTKPNYNGALYFLDIEASLSWDATAGPRLPRAFQTASRSGSSSSEYWNKNAIENNPVLRRMKDAATAPPGFRFPPGIYSKEEQVFRVDNNKYANMYQEVAICGPFRVRGSHAWARYYDEKSKACAGEAGGAIYEWGGNYQIESYEESKCGNCPELDECEKKELMPADCQVTCDGVNKIYKDAEFY